MELQQYSSEIRMYEWELRQEVLKHGIVGQETATVFLGYILSKSPLIQMDTFKKIFRS
ncbi:hypothetical protein ACQV18_03785 [Facklamia sp. P9177]